MCPFNSCPSVALHLSTREECAEIISGKVGECKKMKMKTGPTRPMTVNIDDATTDTLNLIKYQDSFLFHSIQQVRRSEMLGKDTDTSNSGTCSQTRKRNSSALGSSSDQEQRNAQPQTVTRSSCISFECHPSLLLEELLEYDLERLIWRLGS